MKPPKPILTRQQVADTDLPGQFYAEASDVGISGRWPRFLATDMGNREPLFLVSGNHGAGAIYEQPITMLRVTIFSQEEK